MLLLALDTCTERLIAALRPETGNTADRWLNIDSQGNHARDILPAVQTLLEGRKPDAVGIALGPGSFTGVRIGLATAKGLAQGWGVPLFGLDNLSAMAQAWSCLEPGSKAAVLPVIDARKQKFYGGLYREGRVLSAPADRNAAQWMVEAGSAWSGSVVLSGYQGSVLAASLGSELPPGWSVLDTRDWAPGLLEQLEQEWRSGNVLPLDAAPRYLRLSEAEENLQLKSL